MRLVIRKLLFIIIFSFFALHPILSNADTDVSGTISADTTWLLNNSPYVVTGNILIEQGIKLTIEPGVVVKFRRTLFNLPTSITVDGTLDAQGMNGYPITFQPDSDDWVGITFSQNSTPWNEIDQTGCILSDCIIEDANIAIKIQSSSPMIRHSIIRNCHLQISIRSDSPLIYPNIISNYFYDTKNIYHDGDVFELYGPGIIKNNVIISSSDDSPAMFLAVNHVLGNSHLLEINLNTIICTGYGTGICGQGRPCIKIVMGDRLNLDCLPILFTHNSISSYERLPIYWWLNDKNCDFSCVNITENNIENNGGVLDLAFAGVPVDATTDDVAIAMPDNWWGTADTNEIDALIYDQNDDYNLPLVNYLPIATGPIPDIGSSLPVIMPYPPVADAGPDQVVYDSVTLDGSQSYDPDGEIVSYQWQLRHRENSAYDRIAEIPNPIISNLANGFYDVTLTVTDDDGQSGNDYMLMTAAGPCAEWPEPNAEFHLHKFNITKSKKWDWTTTSMFGTIDLPELNLDETVESRITVELFGVLPDEGDLVLMDESTLKVKDRRRTLVIEK